MGKGSLTALQARHTVQEALSHRTCSGGFGLSHQAWKGDFPDSQTLVRSSVEGQLLWWPVQLPRCRAPGLGQQALPKFPSCSSAEFQALKTLFHSAEKIQHSPALWNK